MGATYGRIGESVARSVHRSTSKPNTQAPCANDQQRVQSFVLTGLRTATSLRVMTDPESADAAERIEVERPIAAEPAAIFAVLASPDGHVQVDASGMLMSATGDPVSAVGDTFTVHMDREALNDYPLGLYDVEIEITTFEQDREIAWTIHGAIKPSIGHVYGYRLEPVDTGDGPVTMVTSYYDWSQIDPTWKEAGIFPVISETNQRATLGILARTVAPGKPRPILD